MRSLLSKAGKIALKKGFKASDSRLLVVGALIFLLKQVTMPKKGESKILRLNPGESLIITEVKSASGRKK